MDIRDDSCINVALLGYGYAGKTFHAPLIRTTSGLKLSTIFSSDESKVKRDFPEARVESDAERVLADPEIDLVIIATPNTTHFDLAQRALNCGKHVVVDKPFVTSSDEASTLLKLSGKKRQLLSVFQNRRWDADFLTLKSLLATKKLGEITYFQSNFDRYRPQVQERWREKAIPGSGLWFDLGPHLIDQAVSLFGAPDTVWADLAIQRVNAVTTDYFHVVLTHGRRRIVLHGSSLVLGESPRFTVHGTTGSYIKTGLDRQEQSLKDGLTPGAGDWGQDPDEGVLYLQNNGARESQIVPNMVGNYQAYYAAIRDTIITDQPNPVTAEEALTVMRVLELGVKSAESGKILTYCGAPVA